MDEKFYTYALMKKDLDELKKLFPEMAHESIGKSLWKREIECIKIGEGKTKILFCGAHHGMEHLTSKLLLTFAKNYLTALKNHGTLYNTKAKNLFR